MPRPPGARESPGSPSQLPAPYVPPWKRLGEDLVATLAWLGLKLRELWRRNGEGALPVPPFWPDRWPQLFWPLALVAVLATALAWSRGGLPGLRAQRTGATTPLEQPKAPGPQSPTPTPMAGLAGSAEERSTTGAGSRAQTLADTEGEERREAAHPEPETPGESAPTLVGTDPPKPALEPETENEPDAPSEAEPEVLSEAELLRAQWSADDPDDLITTLRADPATSTLTLNLHGRFFSLSSAKRQAVTERWRQRAEDWGYTHLRLEDGRGRLIGREALVGSGMILLQATAGQSGDSSRDRINSTQLHPSS
jgi:hypothetical protein